MKEQSAIQSFDPLCEVQSDKASVEITSPYDGIVKELLVQEGEVAKVGQELCVIEVDEEEEVSTQIDEDAPSESPVARPPEDTSSTLSPPVASEPETITSVSQDEEIHDKSNTPRRMHPMDPNYRAEVATPDTRDILAKPSVRHYAKQKGVDLVKLMPGSGRDGRVEKKDIDAYLSRGSSALDGSKAQEKMQVSDATSEVVVELGRTRYGMWKAMTKVGALHDQSVWMPWVPKVSHAATIEPTYHVVL